MLKTIRLSIIFLLFFIILFGFFLFTGIKINSFSFGNFSVSQLYLKLDKKMILEVEDIVFDMKESETKSSTEDILNGLKNLENILKFFQKIDIQRLKIKDNEITILLDDKHLYVDNKYINIAANVHINSSIVFLDIYSIYLKDINLTLMGRSKIDLSKKILNFFGNYDYLDLQGEINAQLTQKYFDFYINSTKSVKSIKFLKKLFRLDSVAETWMYDNVQGDINLKYLYGKIDIEKKSPILDSIKGQVVIDDAKINFNKGAKAVDTKKLTINYKDDTLSFDLEKPSYNKSKIYGSKVYIKDLTSLKKGVVYVDLKSKSMLNEDVLEILKSFDINIPLKQESGELDSKLLLKIPYLASRKMDVDGEFKIKNALFKLNDFEFFAKEADVLLKDTIVNIKDSHILHKEMLDTFLQLEIDTKNSTAKGNAKINNFEIKTDKESIVNLKDLETPLNIDFNGSAKIDLKALDTKLDIKDEFIEVDIQDLNKVFNYSSLLQATQIKQGDIKLKIIDEENIDFDINAKGLDFPFEKNSQKISVLSAKGKIRGESVIIKTNNEDIEILLKEGKNPLLKLDNIDLVLSENSKEEEKEHFPDVDLKLKNSSVILDEKNRYKVKWADINIKDSKVSFRGEVLDLDLPISKNKKEIKTLEANGTYENKILNIETKDKKLKLKYDVPNDKLFMNLDGYDVLYDTNQESKKESKIAYFIDGINSNIIINNKYVAKATKYKFIFENFETDIDLNYNNTTFVYHKDFAGHITVEAKNMNDEFLNALMNKALIQGGNVNLSAIGKDGKIKGEASLKDTKIVDLAILNNLLILINTSPAIINPFLAIPSVVGMATNDGFNLNGYRVVEGKIEFNYDFDKKLLNMHKINTKGNGIDFDGYTNIDFNTSKVDAKLHLIFLKNYSKIVGAIPVINYVILGDEKRVDTEVDIYGTLSDPKYKTKLLEEGVSAPVNLIKRVITSPIKLIESIGNSLSGKNDEKKEEEKKEEIEK